MSLSHTWLPSGLLRSLPFTGQVEFVVHALELFRQVDVNDDGGMEWEELVGYIVEAGLSTSGAPRAAVSVALVCHKSSQMPSSPHTRMLHAMSERWCLVPRQ